MARKIIRIPSVLRVSIDPPEGAGRELRVRTEGDDVVIALEGVGEAPPIEWEPQLADRGEAFQPYRGFAYAHTAYEEFENGEPIFYYKVTIRRGSDVLYEIRSAPDCEDFEDALKKGEAYAREWIDEQG